MTVTRREALASLGALAVTAACRREGEPASAEAPTGVIAGDQVELGHRLREAPPPPSAATRRARVVIIGAGVAGLSAAWRLRDAGVTDVEVLELAPEPGGTARGGRSANGAFPWGAHYLPVPNPESDVTLRFLERIGLAVPRPGGGLVFEERHLVFEPEDRLFFRGAWYEGQYLRAGASAADLEQLARFEAEMTWLRERRGSDGRLAFAIPTALSSRDAVFIRLDTMTMARWMADSGYTSPRLRWMVDYACRDDYGADAATVSAWAGIHYFAGRRSITTPETRGSHYFTWPNGNAWLVERLVGLAGGVRTDRIALAVSPTGAVTIAAAAGGLETIQAEAVILATPNHVSAHLLGRTPFGRHAPWLVANLSLRERPDRDTGAWNNVAYEGLGVGYIDSSHQEPDVVAAPVYSYYRPLPLASRGWLLQSSYETLAAEVLADLRPVHPDLPRRLDRLDIWRWGHGTIVPEVGLMFDGRREAFAAAAGVIELAHTDLSGLPFFEEAQYRGVLAAERVMARLGGGTPRWTQG